MKSNLANNKFGCVSEQVIRASDDINIGGIFGLFNKDDYTFKAGSILKPRKDVSLRGVK